MGRWLTLVKLYILLCYDYDDFLLVIPTLYDTMLQISFHRIYNPSSGKKLIGNIRENIRNHPKIASTINLDLKNSENIGQIGKLKKLGEIWNIGWNQIYLKNWHVLTTRYNYKKWYRTSSRLIYKYGCFYLFGN